MQELLFILPTYGHFDYAHKCFESFVRNTPQGIYHIMVVDDASPEWYQQKLDTWPPCHAIFTHFYEQGGLTRSWNEGLRTAKTLGFKYAICGNSDLLFTEGWYEPLKEALETVDLVGPITNAPGHASWQRVGVFCATTPTDDRSYLNRTARVVRDYPQGVVSCDFINGFCMMAKTETWWSGAFDDEHVFDPKYPLTGNEDELQRRWRAMGRTMGFSPRSFVFHYRSVSRPEALSISASKGAYRNERSGSNDRVPANEHSKLVDAGVAERGEVRECQTSCSA